jgi:hypothetical protein
MNVKNNQLFWSFSTHKRGSLTFLDRQRNLTVEGSQLGALLWVVFFRLSIKLFKRKKKK